MRILSGMYAAREGSKLVGAESSTQPSTVIGGGSDMDYQAAPSPPSQAPSKTV